MKTNNGQKVSCLGLPLKTLGDLLRQASPKGDGSGLLVGLSREECWLIERAFNREIEYALATILALAIEENKGEANFDYDCYVYNSETLVFSTHPKDAPVLVSEKAPQIAEMAMA